MTVQGTPERDSSQAVSRLPCSSGRVSRNDHLGPAPSLVRQYTGASAVPMPPVASIARVTDRADGGVIGQQLGAQLADPGAHGAVLLVDRIGLGDERLGQRGTGGPHLLGPTFHALERPAEIYGGGPSRAEHPTRLAHGLKPGCAVAAAIHLAAPPHRIHRHSHRRGDPDQRCTANPK